MASSPSATEVRDYAETRKASAARQLSAITGRPATELENYARVAIENAYRNGFDAGYKDNRYWLDELLKMIGTEPSNTCPECGAVWLGRAIRDGYSRGSRQATLDQLIANPLDPSDIVQNTPVGDGPAQPAPSTRGILSQLVDLVLLTAPAWIPILVLPAIRRRRASLR